VNGETGVDPFNYQPERLDQPGRPLHLLVLVAASMPLSVEVPGPVPISAASCWPAYSLSCKFSLLSGPGAGGGGILTAGPAGQFDAKDSGIQDAVVAVSSATECRSVGSPRAAAPGGPGASLATQRAGASRARPGGPQARTPSPSHEPRELRACDCPGQPVQDRSGPQRWPHAMSESDKPSLGRYRRCHRASFARATYQRSQPA
jgi:hypothetical protein